MKIYGSARFGKPFAAPRPNELSGVCRASMLTLFLDMHASLAKVLQGPPPLQSRTDQSILPFPQADLSHSPPTFQPSKEV
jgi:hypothetical protein